MESPFFSIIIPTWNRRHELERCINSILKQDFENYEIIVVDGASTDGTSEYVLNLKNFRIRIIKDELNLGICPARNMGANVAEGCWFMFVDSDWELLPGTLKKLFKMSLDIDPKVSVIGGYAKTDQGVVWPTFSLPESTFGFNEYLNWLDKCVDGASDWLACYHKSIFQALNWPMDQRSEWQFVLKVAQRSHYKVTSDILMIEHTSSLNRTMNDLTANAWARKVKRAPDEAAMHEELIRELGKELKDHASNVYRACLVQAAMFNFRAGKRLKGIKYAAEGLRLRPYDWRLWGLLFIGVLGPNALGCVSRSRLIKNISKAIRRWPSFWNRKTDPLSLNY